MEVARRRVGWIYISHHPHFSRFPILYCISPGGNKPIRRRGLSPHFPLMGNPRWWAPENTFGGRGGGEGKDWCCLSSKRMGTISRVTDGKRGGIIFSGLRSPPFPCCHCQSSPPPFFRNISFFLRWAGRPFCLDVFCSIHGRLG